ncbi:MAG: MotA/TolQ/ExbB proton channel family protein [Armatimonadota bacterium]
MWDGFVLLLDEGGFTMYILVGCSIIAIGLLMERVYVFARTASAMKAVQDGRETPAWFAQMIDTDYDADRGTEPEQKHEMNILHLSRFLNARLPILATIGGTAPFIGLFGTVVGIMHSFTAISTQKGTGIAVVGSGISEALICTAAGLAVAIFAVVGYNLLRSWAMSMEEDLDLVYLSKNASKKKAASE